MDSFANTLNRFQNLNFVFIRGLPPPDTLLERVIAFKWPGHSPPLRKYPGDASARCQTTFMHLPFKFLGVLHSSRFSKDFEINIFWIIQKLSHEFLISFCINSCRNSSRLGSATSFDSFIRGGTQLGSLDEYLKNCQLLFTFENSKIFFRTILISLAQIWSNKKLYISIRSSNCSNKNVFNLKKF